MKRILLNLLDWIYKKKCYFCGSSKESVKMCSACFEDLEYFEPKVNREILGIKVFCAGLYEDKLQKLIRGLKYHNQRDLAHFQAKYMYNYWKKLDCSSKKFQVIPIPLFKTREKNRKYNHMTLVTKEFCQLTGNEMNLELIKRIKDTKPQYRLNRTQRMENLSKAFKINKKFLKNEPILILDDICTTGSTFESIIFELKKNQINDIVCFATTTPNWE